MPGHILQITRDACPNIIPDHMSRKQNVTKNSTLRRSPRLIGEMPGKRGVTFTPIQGSNVNMAQSHIISQQALNAMTIKETLYPPAAFSPNHLMIPAVGNNIPNYAHYALPMVHPTTGETITSYKRLINDPETAKIWQTAFGKDFGGMAQGDDKTGQKGTNSLFMMKHEEKAMAKNEGKMWMYTRIVIDYKPQKEDPNRVRITVGGNLIKYKGDVSTRTADLTTSKMLWNSVLSTNGAKYMCLDIKNFYLTTALDYFEYMKMPISVFPEWIKKQYEIKKHALNGLRMERAVWGLPQAGILTNKLLHKRLAAHGYYKCINMPGLWRHEWLPTTFTLVVDDFGVKYVGKEHADHLIACIKENTNSPKIGWEIYTAVLISNGITSSKRLKFGCRDI
jgi:hypothetical protein